jgi:tetratricopeptide (TPR) repeat protein
MGKVMEDLGYLEEATRALNQVAEIHVAREDPRDRVVLLIDVSRALTRMGKTRESQAQLAEAVTITEHLDDQELRGEILAEYARILQLLQEYDEAETTLHQLIQLCDKAGHVELGAHAHLGLASNFLAKAYFDEAEKHIQQARSVFSSIRDETGFVLTEYHTARVLLERGQPEQALPHGEKALKFFEKEKNLVAYAESAIVVAQILEQLVQDVRSLRLFDSAIEIFSRLGEQARSLQTRILKGKALLGLGNQKQAEQEFTEVIRYYQEHKLPEQEARVYLQVGEMFYQLARFTEALEQSQLALNVLQNLHEEKLEIQAYRLFLNASKNAQRLEDHLPFLHEAVDKAKAQGKSLLASSLSVSLAQVSLTSQSIDQTKEVLEKAIHDDQLPMELRAEAALNLGLVFMKNEQYTEAAQYLSQAIKEFSSEPSFDRSDAYYQLAEAYRYLNKPNLQKEALIGALNTFGPQSDERLQGKLFFELAPLIEAEDIPRALEYYEKAASIFSKEGYLQEYFETLQKQAKLQAQSSDFTRAIQLIEHAIQVGEELDIPIEIKSDSLPLSWDHKQQALEEAINIGVQQYHKAKSRNIVDKLIDWSSPRKIAKLHPFLADNLGFERCAELQKLMHEERDLLTQIGNLRWQLDQLLPKEMPQEEYKSQSEILHTELQETLKKLNVNRNVIAAACPDPGRGMLPHDYKMLQKLSTLMPSDRRWILINYDVLPRKNLIIVTTLDHIGRNAIHTLPISPDLTSVVQTFQNIKIAQELPPIADLRDMASFLYRSLIPSLLERDLQSHTYGFLHFVTDGFLNNVPFELVFDGKEYWGLKYPMTWTPDLQFFESTLKTKALAQTGLASVILGVKSDPEDRAKRKQDAEEITKSFLGSVPTHQGVTEPIVLFGRDFTRTLLSSNIDQPRSLLYFATPTTLHHRKGEIALQKPDSLRVIEIGVTTLFKGAPILVLDDATRPDPREDELSMVGFLRHLVTAGVPSIVFTRWQPESQLQPAFTQALARQLYEGDPIAVAMLHTRRKLASKGPSPHSWLAYTLCGNPFSTLL